MASLESPPQARPGRSPIRFRSHQPRSPSWSLQHDSRYHQCPNLYLLVNHQAGKREAEKMEKKQNDLTSVLGRVGIKRVNVCQRGGSEAVSLLPKARQLFHHVAFYLRN